MRPFCYPRIQPRPRRAPASASTGTTAEPVAGVLDGCVRMRGMPYAEGRHVLRPPTATVMEDRRTGSPSYADPERARSHSRPASTSAGGGPSSPDKGEGTRRRPRRERRPTGAAYEGNIMEPKGCGRARRVRSRRALATRSDLPRLSTSSWCSRRFASNQFRPVTTRELFRRRATRALNRAMGRLLVAEDDRLIGVASIFLERRRDGRWRLTNEAIDGRQRARSSSRARAARRNLSPTHPRLGSALGARLEERNVPFPACTSAVIAAGWRRQFHNNGRAGQRLSLGGAARTSGRRTT